MTPIQVQERNTTGRDKLNNSHLKDIGLLGVTYLTNMYNVVLKNNKLVNIITIPKSNKGINMAQNPTSDRQRRLKMYLDESNLMLVIRSDE